MTAFDIQSSVSGVAIDPITLEVVRYKLEGIANEMQSTLLRSSFSPVVKEALDLTFRRSRTQFGVNFVASLAGEMRLRAAA
jgi:Hydantoinase B/oxoprolinase